jgi:hypothetical protein
MITSSADNVKNRDIQHCQVFKKSSKSLFIFFLFFFFQFAEWFGLWSLLIEFLVCTL